MLYLFHVCNLFPFTRVHATELWSWSDCPPALSWVTAPRPFGFVVYFWFLLHDFPSLFNFNIMGASIVLISQYGSFYHASYSILTIHFIQWNVCYPTIMVKVGNTPPKLMGYISLAPLFLLECQQFYFPATLIAHRPYFIQITPNILKHHFLYY